MDKTDPQHEVEMRVRIISETAKIPWKDLMRFFAQGVVVMLPDDGHPDYAFTVLDVTGDQRDEIIVWDQEEVWIYTQDQPFSG